MTAIESRLAAVERQLRFQRAVIAGMLIALVALVGYGASEGVPDVIRARKFEVVNESGDSAIVAKTTGNGNGILEMSTGAGQLGLSLHSSSLLGGSLTIMDNMGRTALVADTVLGPAVSLYGKNEKKITTSIDSDGAMLTFLNEDGDVVSMIGELSGHGMISLSNRKGNQTLRFQGENPFESGGALILFNKSGEDVVHLYADEYGQGYLGVFDREGKGRTLTPR